MPNIGLWFLASHKLLMFTKKLNFTNVLHVVTHILQFLIVKVIIPSYLNRYLHWRPKRWLMILSTYILDVVYLVAMMKHIYLTRIIREINLNFVPQIYALSYTYNMNNIGEIYSIGSINSHQPLLVLRLRTGAYAKWIWKCVTIFVADSTQDVSRKGLGRRTETSERNFNSNIWICDVFDKNNFIVCPLLVNESHY